MALQLEVIEAGGQLKLYNLAELGGIVNIGRHTDNNVVIDSPEVAEFHAVLHCQQTPYQLLLLSSLGRTMLAGQPLSAGVVATVNLRDRIEVDGHTLILIDDADQTRAAAPVEGRAAAAPPPEPRPAAQATRATTPPPTVRTAPPAAPLQTTPGAGVTSGTLSELPEDLDSATIYTRFEVREQTVNVEQTAVYQIEVGNRGPQVAEFQLQLEGVSQTWVDKPFQTINLREGEQRLVTFRVTPPRNADSRAGTHFLRFTISSPEYPDQPGRLGASLIINPYYDFSITSLSPEEIPTTWFERAGDTEFGILNKGNTPTPFRVEGADARQGCTFEFDIPGEGAWLARQADLIVPVARAVNIPVHITPLERRFFGFRPVSYRFTITATMLEGQQTSRSLLGQLTNKTLLGPWLTLLLLSLLLLLVVMLFRPRINLFTADPSVVQAGTPALLRWNASRFSSQRIDNNVGSLADRVGEATVIPDKNTTYKIEASNLISRLSFGILDASGEVRVFVTPVPPIIRVFSADRDTLVAGEEVMVNWEVENATEVQLLRNGNPETLRSEEYSAQRDYSLNEETDFILKASNQFGRQEESLTVLVQTPTATPSPTLLPPNVLLFSVRPREITQGDNVTIDWNVSNANAIAIAPIPGDLPPGGSVNQAPANTINYVLSASNGNPGQDVQQVQQVIVNTPTPTPTGTPAPEAPVIVSYTPQDGTEIDQGEQVKLAWIVTGQTTDIQLSGPNFGPVNGLPAEGTLNVSPEEGQTVYVLTARNGELVVSESRQFTINVPEPTKTPTPPPPGIAFQAFAADSAQADRVQLESTDEANNAKTYTVVARTSIRLEWEVRSADTAELVGFGSVPLISNQVIPASEVIQDRTFNLKAENQGTPAQAFVIINVEDPEPPPGPTRLTGEIDGNQTVLQWEFDGNENEINGFRIYRADIPPGTDFRAIGDVGKDVSTYTDPDFTCGKIYYVVALYIDINGNIQETDSSGTNWASPPCP